MTAVTIQEAQARLPELLRQLQPGEEIIITDHGAPLAQVKKTEHDASQSQADSAKAARSGPGLGKGMITILSDDDDHLKDFAEYMP